MENFHILERLISLKLKLNSDGTYEGSYLDKKKGDFELKVKGQQSDVIKSPLPNEAELKVKSNHHEVSLALEKNGKPSGTIKSQLTKE